MEWVWKAVISVNFQDSTLLVFAREGREKAAFMEDDFDAEI